MTLLDAPQYDPARDRRRRAQIIGSLIVVLVLGTFAWTLRHWPEEHLVDKFFSTLQAKDYETAYGIWFHDPEWKAHQAEYTRYPFNEFYKDWGPGGEWGVINRYKIFWSGNCPVSGSGLVVDVVVNGRDQHAQVYVDKRDKTFSFVPCPLEVR